MKILGNKVYLDLPEVKEYKVTVSDEVKFQMQQELMQKIDRLTVFAKGEGMGEGKALLDQINIGDEVFIDPVEARRAVIFDVDGKKKMSVNVFNVMHIW